MSDQEASSLALHESLKSRFQPASVGLFLATLTILFGQFLGIVFGLNEAAIKDRLQVSAAAVKTDVYHDNDNFIQTVLLKSWTYIHRAHLHAGAMGTNALALILAVGLLGNSRRTLFAIGLALGGGGLGYSVFWMWAGFLAPALGGTGAAKEALAWLAIPSSGSFVLGTIASLYVLVRAFFKRSSP